MDLGQKVLTGLRWSAAGRFFSQLITWAVTIFVMRLVSPSDYGLMSMAGIFLFYLISLNEFGFGAVLVQKNHLDVVTIRQIFCFLILANCFSCLVLFTLAPWIGVLLKEDRIIAIIRMLSVQLVLSCFSIIPQASLERKMLFEKRSVIDVCAVIAGSLTSLWLALYEFGVWALVWGSLVISISRTILLNLVAPFCHLPRFSFAGMRDVFSFGGYVTIIRLMWLFYSQADVLIIGRLLGKELLGFYSVALTLATLPMEKVSGIINQVAFPAYALTQADNQKASAYYLKSVRVMSFLAFPTLWGISSISPELIRVFLGEKWLLSVLPVQLISLIIPLRMIGNLTSPAVMGVGRPDVSFTYTLLSMLIIPCGILVAVKWGLLGVCLAWVVFYPPILAFYLSQTAKVFNLKFLDVVSTMAKPLLAAFVMYFTVSAVKITSPLDHHLMLHTFSLVLTGIVVYSAMVLLITRDLCQEVFGLIRLKTPNSAKPAP
jgi:teichuronic acid exporter